MAIVAPERPSTPRIVSNRERLSGVVQAVGKRPADIQRRWWESAAIFAVFTVLYSVIGYWLVVEKHVVGFETLDRWTRALMIWRNEPPKLSSVGFDYAPLSVLLLAPFAFVPVLTKSLIIIPVVSAVFAGSTMVVLNTMLRRAQVLLPVRLMVLAALGLNPLVVMYASIGARSFLWLAFVVAALGALFAWYVTADIRFVMIAGLAFAVASLTGYGSLVFFLISLVMVAAILARLGADGTEIEGTTVGFASPTVYVIALWSLFNLILLFKPLNWLTASSDTAASGGLADFSLLDILRGTLDLVLYGAPLAIVVLPALLVAGVARRNGFALWLGLMLLVSIVAPGLAVLVRVTDSPMLMNNALPILLVSVIGAIWLARSAVQGATVVAGVLAAALLLSIPWTFAAMDDFQQQGVERAFHDAVLTGDSQEGARTVDGSVVGYDNERAMADYILDHADSPDSILTDNASTYAVILMTGKPSIFFDRVDESDGPWNRAAKDPAGHADYMLLSTSTATDLLSRLYPAAAARDDTLLKEVYGNARYTLVAVPDGYTFGAVAPKGETSSGDGDGAEQGETDAPAPDPGGVGGVVGEPGSTGTATR
ncbi:hypothetical protein [Nocardioides plantarum]|uniref:Uncharacterized protein n=1 Tax=Nocardioides plantarum TaxID=29299 RepID=A0ABV5K7Y8_9ACTN|nr:hypothetical protein [Nocardioides plantarum]